MELAVFIIQYFLCLVNVIFDGFDHGLLCRIHTGKNRGKRLTGGEKYAIIKAFAFTYIKGV